MLMITQQTFTTGQWMQLTGMGLVFLVWCAMVVTLFVLARRRRVVESVDAADRWKRGSSGALLNMAFFSLVSLMLLGGLGFLRAQHIFQSSDPYGEGLNQFTGSLEASGTPPHSHDGWSVTAAQGTVKFLHLSESLGKLMAYLSK